MDSYNRENKTCKYTKQNVHIFPGHSFQPPVQHDIRIAAIVRLFPICWM